VLSAAAVVVVLTMNWGLFAVNSYEAPK